MGYYDSQITCVGDYPQQSGRWLVVQTEHRDKIIQCYVSGELVGWRKAPLGKCEFFVSHIEQTDLVLFLAVDSSDTLTNYWEDAFSQISQQANRIRVSLPRLILKYGLSDKWRIYLSGDDHVFKSPVFERELFADGKGACGYGLGYRCGYGFDGQNAPGYGKVYDGEYGLEYEDLVWASDTLSPGNYEVSVTLVDAAGNESEAFEQDVSVTGFARPASDLKVCQYDSQTQNLTLGFARSEDL